MRTSRHKERTPGYARRAWALAAVLACAVVATVVGVGALAADATGTLAVDADPAGSAQSAADSLGAAVGDAADEQGAGEKDAPAAETTAPAAESAAATDATASDAAIQAGGSGFSYEELPATDAFPFYCCVLVNGEWKYLTTDGQLVSYISTSELPTTRWYSSTWAGNGRRFVRADQLEGIYGPLFGFAADDLVVAAGSYSGNSLFGVSDNNTVGTIWNDLAPWYLGTSVSGGASGATSTEAASWAVPLCRKIANNWVAYLYYLPANVAGTSSYFTKSKPTQDAQLIKDNTFYTVAASDDGNLVYAQGEKLPATKYVLAGNGCQVTLKTPTMGSGLTWTCSTSEGTLTPSSTTYSKDGSEVTLSFDSVTGPISIMPAREGQASFSATFQADTLADSLTTLGELKPTGQEMLSDGRVEGKGSVTRLVAAGDSLTMPYIDAGYEALGVRRINAGTGASNRRFFYSFAGWEVTAGGQTHVFAAGETISADELALLNPSGASMTFKAKWSAQDEGTNRIRSANFYVNIKFEIADNMSNGFVAVPASDFTDSVFATRVNGAVGLKGDGTNGGYNNANYLTLLAPPTESSNAYSVDTILRSMVSTPYVPDNKSLYTDGFTGVTLDSFPADADVLEAVRNSGKTLKDGSTVIDPATVTPDNYTVRWYSLKYEKSDGWHVDGILVRKEARLVVTKTFAGDPEAVSRAKEKFTITIAHDGQSDYELNLNPYDEGTNKAGYTSYDAATDTYTWSVSARQGTTYTLSENDNVLEDAEDGVLKWSSGCWYKITNSDAETDGWQPLGQNSIRVTAESYGSDTPESACQTVAFRNVYAKSDVVRLSKVDSVTGNPISGVAFDFLHEDGTPVQLYQRSDGSNFYSILPNEEYGLPVEGGRVTTGTDGSVYLTIGKSATGEDNVYKLLEEGPVGYKSLYGVRLTVNMAEGYVRSAAEIDSDGSEVTGSDRVSVGADGHALVVKNSSEVLTSVRAVKNWGSTPDSARKQVTVSLWRNGAKLVGDKYTQVLSADNGWSCVWGDLPLFVDGKLAQYALREDKIGGTDYDAGAGSDGYADYLVTQDKVRYSDSSASSDPADYRGEAYWQDDAGVWHYATYALLVINNLPTTGDLSFAKVDGSGGPLADALFYLYSDEDRTQVIQTARSSEAGQVTFSSLREGTYWVKEREAPKGYERDESVYKVVVSGGKATMTRVGDDSNTPVSAVSNHFKATLSVHKMNSAGQTLPGATFELRSLDAQGNETVVDTQQANENGVAEFDGVDTGSYVIVETVAPAGYELPDEGDAAYVTVNEGSISYGRQSGPSWMYRGGVTVYEGALFVVDAPVFDLPTAGGPGIAGMVAGGTALMCGAAWLWLRRGRRGGRHA